MSNAIGQIFTTGDRKEFEMRMRGVIETLEAVAEEIKVDNDERFEEVVNAAMDLRKWYGFEE